jgi:hypothetical protein
VCPPFRENYISDIGSYHAVVQLDINSLFG